ncbi:uncharacterized protein LOC124132067 [Haliotis rufescens]|uniref:uncharacterized protein LOC124132067 n=1 Tax=Haliotis rufescens TaxID=6454 RepID=UPI00201E9770|nr:uncharacterized protein LOC124132067 [Haliotis rufescens]XP_046351652.2 uncharacterized protein LOC124132067 [Haliotis rufescens]
MSRSFDDNHSFGYSENTLPRVERSQTTWAQHKSHRSRQNKPHHVRPNHESPELVCENISPFPDHTMIIPQNRRPADSVHVVPSETYTQLPSARNLSRRLKSSKEDEQRLKYNAAFYSERGRREMDVAPSPREKGLNLENIGSSVPQHRLAFTQQLQTLQPNSSQSMYCRGESVMKHDVLLRRRPSVSHDVESRTYSPMPRIPNPHSLVPRLNLPPDLGLSRENTLVEYSRRSGVQTTPTAQENTGPCFSSTPRDNFTMKPKEISDPLDYIQEHQVQEKKYSILPSIGTPRHKRKGKGGNSQHLNQLDYTREQYESDAEFFSDYNTTMDSPDIISHEGPVPLPPIQISSGRRNHRETQTRKHSVTSGHKEGDEQLSSSEISFSERLITETSPPGSK